MNFYLDLTGAVPIYEQVTHRMKDAIAVGEIAPGEWIPSVRELARELAINPNTVARAYRDLQREGVVLAQRGLGLEVASDAPEQCRRERVLLFEQRVDRLLAEAIQSRFDAATIRGMIQPKLDGLTMTG